MSLSMYEASIPVLVKQLENLSSVLKKGEAYASSKKIEPEGAGSGSNPIRSFRFENWGNRTSAHEAL